MTNDARIFHLAFATLVGVSQRLCPTPPLTKHLPCREQAASWRWPWLEKSTVKSRLGYGSITSAFYFRLAFFSTSSCLCLCACFFSLLLDFLLPQLLHDFLHSGGSWSLAKVKAKLENKVLCLSAQTRRLCCRERARAFLPPHLSFFFHFFLCIAQVCGNHDDDDDDGDADADDHVAHADEEPPDDKFAHSCDGQWPHLKCN